MDGVRSGAKARMHDISLPIHSTMLTWPGDPPVILRPTSRISQGGAANVSELRLGSHTGTHVDPPFHFLDGAATIDQVPLDLLVGEAVLVEVSGAQVGVTELEELGIPQGAQRLLLKTSNSRLWEGGATAFPVDYVVLTTSGAEWIVEHGIRLVGIDFLSIERDGPPSYPVHRTLLEAGMVIVEGLDLSAVEPGRYTLACLPLRILGGDGAPARAVLFGP